MDCRRDAAWAEAAGEAVRAMDMPGSCGFVLRVIGRLRVGDTNPVNDLNDVFVNPRLIP
jgi:hypothetical protein